MQHLRGNLSLLLLSNTGWIAPDATYFSPNFPPSASASEVSRLDMELMLLPPGLLIYTFCVDFFFIWQGALDNHVWPNDWQHI